MTKKELVDEIMKASEDYPNAILYMESLMENYEQLKDNWNKLKEWLEEMIDYEEYDKIERDTFKKVLSKIQEIEGAIHV